MAISVEDQERAQAVVDLRVVSNTKKAYSRAIRKFERWLEEHYPTCMEEVQEGSSRRIKLPLSADVVVSYLASIQRKADGKLRAASTMVMVSSAINDLYRARASKGEAVSICPIFKSRVNTFMAGHKRMVAAAKENGELPIVEGKRELSFNVSF